MVKKYFFLVFVLLLLTSCSSNKRYSKEYVTLFDTYIVFTAYADSEKSFTNYCELLEGELNYLHKQFDIFNSYENINNIKTINDTAYIKPVKVSNEIIDLLSFSKDAYEISDKSVNVAMGSVLSTWHDYREAGSLNPEKAKLPPMDLLENENLYSDIDSLVIDKNNNTVFIKNPNTKIDVGALSKGYAADIIASKLKDAGLKNGLLNLGGNVIAFGTPQNKKKLWGIGVQNPDNNSDKKIIDSIYGTDFSVVTSGDYQRYYTVDNKNYNHIISPKTLMPAENFKSVTIIHKESKMADCLSTALFVLSKDEGVKLLDKYNAKAILVFKDGRIEKYGVE